MSDIALSGLQSDDEDDEDVSDKKLLARIKQEIKFYETKAGPWERKVKKIVRRYKDERNNGIQKDNARYNILWSNTQLLLPALYAKKPVANIERRNRIKDDLGRVSSQILERCISFFIDDKLDAALRQAVLDNLLCGRGIIWARYEPKFAQGEPLEITDEAESETYEQLVDEKICWDYVTMEDFGHSWGRFWEEVSIIWRKVPMDRKEQKERFEHIDVDKIPLDYSPKDSKDSKISETVEKSVIYEVWNKDTNKAYWLSVGYEEGFLDEQEDPLKLQDFFPTPRPLFATLANDSCIPTPDYILYQDQAIELDELTGRIAAIVKSVKVAGVYDASAQGVQRLLSDGVQNQLLPVDQWAMLSEKGGLGGVMSLLPMEDILKTLLGLYEAREKVKQDIYEITGISDILRGASDPNETYGAQRIKSAFGTLRLSARQDEVQRFCRDLIDIGTQIIAQHFSQETIQRISNMTLLMQQDKQLVEANDQYQAAMAQFRQAQQQSSPQLGQPMQMPPPMPPPLPPDVARIDSDDLEELMGEPTWEDIMQFMQDQPLMSYRVDIETDSTIKIDQQAEQQSRVQFLETAGQFIEKSMQAPPELAPLLAKMMEFGLRSFKIGRELEGEFEMTIKKLEKQAQNPQPKPNPEMLKLQTQQQMDQQKLQLESQLDDKKLQQEKELKIMQMQIDEKKAQADSAAEIKRLQMQAQVDTNQASLDAQLAREKSQQDDTRELAVAKMEAETKIAVAEIQAKSQLQNTAITAFASGNKSDNGDTKDMPDMTDLIKTVVEQLQQGFGGMSQAIMRPRTIVRDEQRNIIGSQ